MFVRLLVWKLLEVSEVKSFFFKIIVFPPVEPVKPCSTVRNILLLFIQFNQQTGRQHFLPEVPFINRFLQNIFIKALEMGKSKFIRQQFESQRLETNFSLQFSESHFRNCRMIEGKSWGFA